MAEEEKDERRWVTGRGKRKQARRRRSDGWSAKDEKVFLHHYRATGNVAASAHAAGKSANSAYTLRRTDPVFRALCDEALRESLLRLHSNLIVYAETKGKKIEPGEVGEPGAPDLANFDPELALKILRYHDERDGRRRGRASIERVNDEELTAALLLQLDALDRRRKRRKI